MRAGDVAALGNLAVHGIDHLQAAIENRLKRMPQVGEEVIGEIAAERH
ncbi:hypothetical protein [Streptosporangium carneum]|uniref:Uncharacterized protein n=1 Tax=Streptosporangium carneum TaxID=47481 RepID=A0A9W6MHX2_9ACTN|nr:hypothetical protein [Streptosporangium carneum]GLK14398.1 hypothetical protein GCM10017600_78100 [Streptosporangium carneum]